MAEQNYRVYQVNGTTYNIELFRGNICFGNLIVEDEQLQTQLFILENSGFTEDKDGDSE